MNKFITITFVGIFTINSAYSSSIINKFTPKLTNPAMQTNKQAVNEEHHTGFSNFTGNWQGTCTHENGIRNETSINIKQFDSQFIVIDEDGYAIGNTYSENLSNKWINSSEMAGFTWNENQTKLQMKDIYTLAQPIINQAQPMQSMFIKLSLAIENNELVITGKTNSYKDMELIDNDTFNCTLNKKDA